MIGPFNPQALQRLRYCGHRHFIGGSSESSQETKNFDQRVVGGDNSQNLSTNSAGDTVITLTDNGAVSGALSLAARGIEAVQQTSAVSMNTNADILAGVLKHTGAQQAGFTDTLKSIENKDTTTLVIAGMVVIAIVGAAMLKHGKA